MSVKVIRNRVYDGTNTYEIGDVIEGLSDKDESQLISEGIVEYINKREDFILPDKSINAAGKVDEHVAEISKADEPLVVNIDKEEATIDEETIEEDQVQNVDLGSFELNTEEYVNIPAAKKKK